MQKRIYRNHTDEKIYTPNTFPKQSRKDTSINIGFLLEREEAGMIDNGSTVYSLL